MVEKRKVPSKEKRKRILTIEHLMRLGWNEDRIVEGGKELLGIGRALTLQVRDAVLARWQSEGFASMNTTISRAREITQVDEMIRKLLDEEHDVLDPETKELVKKGVRVDMTNLIKLLVLRADLTGSKKAAGQASEKLERVRTYLGISEAVDVGGADLVEPEE